MRFTIRELVLLTLVVAMGVGWWVDRRRLQAAVLLMEDAAHNVASSWAKEVDHTVKYRLVDDREWRTSPPFP